MMVTGWKAVVLVGSAVVSGTAAVVATAVNVLNARKLSAMDEKLERVTREVVPNYAEKKETQHAASAAA